MIKMKDVYVKNPALGDPATLDKQLEENGQKLDKLQQELNKYEVRNESDDQQSWWISWKIAWNS